MSDMVTVAVERLRAAIGPRLRVFLLLMIFCVCMWKRVEATDGDHGFNTINKTIVLIVNNSKKSEIQSMVM
jgi:hypothetical protein